MAGAEDVAASCASPTLRLSRLDLPAARLRRLGSRRHNCHLVHRACLYRRKVLLEGEPPTALMSMRVRGVHVGFDVQRVGALGLFARRRNLSLLAGDASFSRGCTPLMWWPLWAYNLGEFFQSSVLGVQERSAFGAYALFSVHCVPTGSTRTISPT